MPKKLTLPLKQKKLTNIPQEEEVQGQLPQTLLQKPKPKPQPMSFLLPDEVGFEHQFSPIENIKQSNMYKQLFPKEPITKRTSGGSGVVEIYMTQQDQKQDQNNFVVVKRFQTPGEYKKQKQKFTRCNKQSSKIYFPQFITEYQNQADLYEALPMRNRFGKAKTLDELLKKKSTLDPTQLQTLANNLIQAVTTINADGIFHGDIKPENIIVSPTLEVQFIDVGSMGFQNKDNLSQQYQWRGTESPLYCPDWFVTMRSRNKFSFSEMVKLDQFAMAKIVSNMFHMFRSKQQTDIGKTIKKWLKQGEAMDKKENQKPQKKEKKEQSTTQPLYQRVAHAA